MPSDIHFSKTFRVYFYCTPKRFGLQLLLFSCGDFFEYKDQVPLNPWVPVDRARDSKTPPGGGASFFLKLIGLDLPSVSCLFVFT